MDGRYTKLNTEVYGGMQLGLWTDRPLSAAGRAVGAYGARGQSSTLRFEEGPFLIPGLTYPYEPGGKLRREAGSPEGHSPCWAEKKRFLRLAPKVGVRSEDVLPMTLRLQSGQRNRISGRREEFRTHPNWRPGMRLLSAVTAFLKAETRKRDGLRACSTMRKSAA